VQLHETTEVWVHSLLLKGHSCPLKSSEDLVLRALNVVNRFGKEFEAERLHGEEPVLSNDQRNV
jgi:hypothetical protein